MYIGILPYIVPYIGQVVDVTRRYIMKGIYADNSLVMKREFMWFFVLLLIHQGKYIYLC